MTSQDLHAWLHAIWVCALVTMTTAAGDEEYCGFMDNAASCHVTIADQYPVYVRARINECSRPVDVTFSIKFVNTSWSWDHTFANSDEIQPLPGLEEDAYLQVALHAQPDHRLHVFASFDVSSLPAQVFIDDVTKITGLASCEKPGNPNAYLPLVIFIILLILILALIVTVVGLRRHVVIKRQSNLLSNMEPAGTSYHDEPAIISSSTTIKNEIYRDTVTSISEDDHSTYSPDNRQRISFPHRSSSTSEGCAKPIPPPLNGRKKRSLRYGLPQPVLEQLPEESGEEEYSSSREVEAGINPSVPVTT